MSSFCSDESEGPNADESMESGLCCSNTPRVSALTRPECMQVRWAHGVRAHATLTSPHRVLQLEQLGPLGPGADPTTLARTFCCTSARFPMTLSCISWQLAVSFHLRGGTASELAHSQSRMLQAKTRCWPGYVPIVVAGSRRVHDTCLSVFLCVCLSVSRSKPSRLLRHMPYTRVCRDQRLLLHTPYTPVHKSIRRTYACCIRHTQHAQHQTHKIAARACNGRRPAPRAIIMTRIPHTTGLTTLAHPPSTACASVLLPLPVSRAGLHSTADTRAQPPSHPRQ